MLKRNIFILCVHAIPTLELSQHCSGGDSFYSNCVASYTNWIGECHHTTALVTANGSQLCKKPHNLPATTYRLQFSSLITCWGVVWGVLRGSEFHACHTQLILLSGGRLCCFLHNWLLWGVTRSVLQR